MANDGNSVDIKISLKIYLHMEPELYRQQYILM